MLTDSFPQLEMYGFVWFPPAKYKPFFPTEMMDNSLTPPGIYCYPLERFWRLEPDPFTIRCWILSYIKCFLLKRYLCNITTQASLAQGHCCHTFKAKNSFQESSLQVILLLEPSCRESSLMLPYTWKPNLCCCNPSQTVIPFRPVQWVYLTVHMICVCSLHKSSFHSWNCDMNSTLSWNTCLGRFIQQTLNKCCHFDY